MVNPERGPGDPKLQVETIENNGRQDPQSDREPKLADFELPKEIEHVIHLQQGLKNAISAVRNFVIKHDYYKPYDVNRDRGEQEKLENRYHAHMVDVDRIFFNVVSFVLEEARSDTTPMRRFEICGAIRDALHEVSKFREVEIPSRELVYSLISDNLSRLEDPELKDGELAIFDIISEAGNFGSDKETKKVVDFLVGNLPKIEQFLSSRDPYFLGELASIIKDAHFESITRALTVLANFGPEHHGELLGMISRLLSEINTLKSGAHILGGLLYYGDKLEEGPDKGEERRDIFLSDRYCFEAKAKQLLQDTLERYGVAGEYASIYTKKWTASHGKRDWFVARNLAAVANLESAPLAHGITKRLTDSFGIVEFGRYPESMLFEQDRETGNMDRPYGIILFPKTDWNGAFYNSKGTFAKLESSFDAGPELVPYLLRIFECGSRKDVGRILNDLDTQYGDTHKISFAIIGGHGTKDSIQLGEFREHSEGKRGNLNNELTPDDLQGSRVHEIGGFFEPGATIILESCSTGQEEGIGQKLSQKFGLKVIAPREPVGLVIITPYIRGADGKLNFTVDYGYGRDNIRAVYGPNIGE